jgi:hypothetical protein
MLDTVAIRIQLVRQICIRSERSHSIPFSDIDPNLTGSSYESHSEPETAEFDRL